MATLKTYILQSDLLGELKLSHRPVGYDNTNRTYERSRKYHSFKSTYTQTLEFYFDGAQYLKQAFELGGIEEEVFCYIYEQDDEDLTSELEYIGRINLSSYEYNHEEGSVKVNIEQLGFAQQLFNNDNVKVDMGSTRAIHNGASLPPLPVRKVGLSSKTLVKLSVLEAQGSKDEPSYFGVSGWDSSRVNGENPDFYWIPGLDNAKQSEIKKTITYSPRWFAPNATQATWADATPITDDQYFLKAEEAGEYTVSLNWDINVVTEHYTNYQDAAERTMYMNWVFVHMKPSGAATYLNANNTALEFVSPTVLSGQKIYRNLNWKGTEQVGLSLGVGDRVFVYAQVNEYNWTAFRSYTCRYEMRTSNLSLTFSGATVTDSSNAEGLFIADVFKRVVESVVGKVDVANTAMYDLRDGYRTSINYDTIRGKRIILNGFHIRGWTMEEKPVHSSLKDIFETMNAIDNVGLGIRQRLDAAGAPAGFEAYVAPVEEFYRKDVVLNLGCVGELKKTINREFIFNEAIVGYNKYQSDGLNSLDEFNTQREMKTGITQLKGKYEAVSPYRTDGYGAEDARRQPRSEFPNKTTSYDSDNFLFCVERNGASEWRNEAGEIILEHSNILNPETTPNVRISPGRMLKRHLSAMVGAMVKYPDNIVRFTYGPVNALMKTRIVGENLNVAENQSYGHFEGSAARKYPTPLILPEQYTFTKLLTREQVRIFEADPYGAVQIKDEKGEQVLTAVLKLELDEDRVGTFTVLKHYQDNG